MNHGKKYTQIPNNNTRLRHNTRRRTSIPISANCTVFKRVQYRISGRVTKLNQDYIDTDYIDTDYIDTIEKNRLKKRLGGYID